MGRCRSSVTLSSATQQETSPSTRATPTTLPRRISTNPVSVTVVMTIPLFEVQGHPRPRLSRRQADNGNEVRALLAQLPAESPAGVVRSFLALIRPVVQESARGSGCAVAAAAMASSAHDHDGLHDAAAVALGPGDARAPRRPR